MHKITGLVAGFLIFALIAGCAPNRGTHVGRAAPVAAEKQALRNFTLANGVKVVMNELPDGPVSVQAWFDCGSVTDPQNKTGLAHMVEHMIFTGSKQQRPGWFEHDIEAMGGTVSGHTSRDFSYYGVTVPVAPGWERAVEKMYDIICFPSLDPRQLEQQKKIVRLEISDRASNPDSVLIDNFYDQAFSSHPYRNLITGTKRDLDTIMLKDVSDYHSRMYIPANLTVVVAGPVKQAEARALVERTFGSLKSVKPLMIKPQQEAFPFASREKTELMPVENVYMAIGWRVCPATNPDIYALEVLSAIIGQGKGSRLYQDLRERNGLAFNIRCDLLHMQEQGVLVIMADLAGTDDIHPVTDEILLQMNRIKDEDISSQEIDRAINRIASMELHAGETSEGQAYALGYSSVVFGSIDTAAYVQNIRKVSPADVKRVAQRYLGEGNYIVSLVKPETR